MLGRVAWQKHPYVDIYQVYINCAKLSNRKVNAFAPGGQALEALFLSVLAASRRVGAILPARVVLLPGLKESQARGFPAVP